MYSPYYNYAPQKKRGIEELYKTEEKPKTDAPTEKASTDSKGSTTQSKPQEKAVEVKGGFPSLFGSFREDDIVLAFVFLAILNERNEEDAVILVILALLFFT